MNLQDRALLPEEMRHTYSVCPVCLKRIPAKREERDGQIYLVKTCPDHGTFSSVIWRNKRKFADWRGERPAVGENENLNCPAGCGLCAEHRRATCCTLLEITARCNMNCTFLFCGAGRGQGSVLRHGKTLDRRSDGAGKDTFAAFRRGTDSAGRSAGDRGVCEAGWL